MRTNSTSTSLVAAESEKDVLGAVYRAPQLHEVGSAVKMVQGSGGTAGFDCRYYYNDC